MGMRKTSVRDLEVRGKRVFVRVDFNVPLKNGRVADDTRIRASLPTLRLILEAGGRAIIASHLGRPKGHQVPAMSLRPVVEPLKQLLGQAVRLAPDCAGPEVETLAHGLADGEALLLENLRFHAGEEADDEAFARQLAALSDLYVNDAFGSAHRAHASVSAITRFLPMAAAGLLMEREIEMLTRLLDRPEKPYIALLGGAKVSDKIDLIHTLIPRVDAVLVGGAMAYTFMQARGTPVGASRVEADRLEQAREIISRAMREGVRLHLPIDHVVAPSTAPGERAATTPGPEIPDGMIGFDIGPRTRESFREEIVQANTIFWNGPLGMFEVPPYDAGTQAAAEAIAGRQAFSVIGGGDSVAAVNRFGLASRITHISTGGGASLEFLSGVELPGVAALSDAR